MMLIPRKALALLEEEPHYHCISNCARRAILCGVDAITDKSFDHRRQWIIDRIKQLSDIFAIDTCAYSVMSNHYHVKLHVGCEGADEWTYQEVIERWEKLFSLHVIVQCISEYGDNCSGRTRYGF